MVLVQVEDGIALECLALEDLEASVEAEEVLVVALEVLAAVVPVVEEQVVSGKLNSELPSVEFISHGMEN